MVQKLPIKEYAKIVTGEVEDELHAIMSCSKYDNSREIMVQSLNETFPFFELLDYKDQFLFIMKCNYYEITHALSKMLSEIKQTWGSLWSEHKSLLNIK